MTAGTRSAKDPTGATIGILVVTAVIVTVVAIWFLVRAMNATANAFEVRPRSRLLWGLVAMLVLSAALAALTGAAGWWTAAAVIAAILVFSARAIVESSQPLMRDPAGHEFLEEVKHEWWPAAPGRGWAELE